MKAIKAPPDRWCYFYVGVQDGETKEEVYYSADHHEVADAAQFNGGSRGAGGTWQWVGLWQGPSGRWYVYKDHAGWLRTIENDATNSSLYSEAVIP